MIFNSVAYEAGVKNRDFVVEVNGTKVFEMSQDEFKELIKKAGDQIHLKVERYITFNDHDFDQKVFLCYMYTWKMAVISRVQ